VTEANKAVVQWTREHGRDDVLVARAAASLAPAISWETLTDLTVDTDQALDGALALGLQRLAAKNLSPGAPPWRRPR
jgi:hypothetical protein